MSVVTPTLNQAAYLEDTLRSVAAQSHPHLEHVVVDGGSTDGTIDILRRWEASHGIVWRSERDGGMYEAVNKGLALARGTVLAYLNSDDQWFPWTAEVAVRAFARHPKTGFVFGDVLNFDDIVGAGTLVLYPPAPWAALRRSGALGQPAVLWTREVHEAIGPFDETLRLAADTDYWIRVARRFPGARVDEVLAWEREYPTRSSQALADRLSVELTRVRARHAGDHAASGPARHAADRVRAAARHRKVALRLLAAAVRRPSGGPWSHFLAHEDFALDRAALAKSLVPAVGSRHVRYVSRTGR